MFQSQSYLSSAVASASHPPAGRRSQSACFLRCQLVRSSAALKEDERAHAAIAHCSAALRAAAAPCAWQRGGAPQMRGRPGSAAPRPPRRGASQRGASCPARTTGARSRRQPRWPAARPLMTSATVRTAVSATVHEAVSPPRVSAHARRGLRRRPRAIGRPRRPAQGAQGAMMLADADAAQLSTASRHALRRRIRRAPRLACFFLQPFDLVRWLFRNATFASSLPSASASASRWLPSPPLPSSSVSAARSASRSARCPPAAASAA